MMYNWSAIILLTLSLLTACSKPVHESTPLTATIAQQFIERALRRYWQGRYALTLAGHEESLRFLQRDEKLPTPTLPAAVAEAYQYYFTAVERADWGNVYLLSPNIDGRPFYMIYVTTDGDDGWIELYSLDGSTLGTARRYLELVSWGDQTTLRQQTRTGEFPTALSNRFHETLWGK